MKPAMLSVSAPTEEQGKAIYMAVNAVWSPRNKTASVEKIRTGIAAFGEVVKGLRDAWRAKNEALKLTEIPDSKTAADAPRIKDEVIRYRGSMEKIMHRSLMFGHESVVKRYVYNFLPEFPFSSHSRDDLVVPSEATGSTLVVDSMQKMLCWLDHNSHACFANAIGFSVIHKVRVSAGATHRIIVTNAHILDSFIAIHACVLHLGVTIIENMIVTLINHADNAFPD